MSSLAFRCFIIKNRILVNLFCYGFTRAAQQSAEIAVSTQKGLKMKNAIENNYWKLKAVHILKLLLSFSPRGSSNRDFRDG